MATAKKSCTTLHHNHLIHFFRAWENDHMRAATWPVKLEELVLDTVWDRALNLPWDALREARACLDEWLEVHGPEHLLSDQYGYHLPLKDWDERLKSVEKQAVPWRIAADKALALKAARGDA